MYRQKLKESRYDCKPFIRFFLSFCRRDAGICSMDRLFRPPIHFVVDRSRDIFDRRSLAAAAFEQGVTPFALFQINRAIHLPGNPRA